MGLLVKGRLNFLPKLPDILEDISKVSMVSLPTPMYLDAEVGPLLPHTGEQSLLVGTIQESVGHRPLRVGVVLSGGQAPGGHNVITGLFDALKKLNAESLLFGFLHGPGGILKKEHLELTEDFLKGYRNQGGFDMIGSGRTKIETPEQFRAAEEAVRALDLDGLVIIGGDDSNTNAALLAEYFVEHGVKTKVIGVPKTIDGDLKNEHIEIPFGFDTATKIYSEIIGNIARDALSAGKYYFFIRIMGRSASHIALECAQKTHPNYTIISEEIAAKKKTLKEMTDEMCDVICDRAAHGKNYGLFLIPEGTVEFIPEFRSLIGELNDLLSKHEHEEAMASLPNRSERVSYAAQHLSEASRKCFENLPMEIQSQLVLDRDPHGNVKVSMIEMERLFIELATAELERRKAAGKYSGSFSPLSFFCGYEGRSGLPSNFDAQYCYSLGHVAALLIDAKATGYMAVVQNLASPVEEWRVSGIPISTMMTMEKRKGKLKPVIKKALVDLDGSLFRCFAREREGWKSDDDYQYPGPIQFYGPQELTEEITITLQEQLLDYSSH